VNKAFVASLLAILAAVPCARAGMYDQPYAIIESRNASEVRNEARLAINKVDGQGTRDPRKTDPLAPGKHTVTVHFESARGNFRPAYQDVEIDLAPCTRYSIVASYKVKSGPDWKPKVYSESIGECVKKFKK
jgi:hypothetical protein